MKKLSKYRLSNHEQAFRDYDEALAVAETWCRTHGEPLLLTSYNHSGRLAEWQVICTERSLKRQAHAFALSFEDRPSIPARTSKS
ncbi:hypothetical protein [Hydrocarboniphaga effusa]|uniref:hypothetical protein n=1 Tax=Hydrocarboniphaga effusa TaxID=243629 RepID=UPI003BACBAF5